MASSGCQAGLRKKKKTLWTDSYLKQQDARLRCLIEIVRNLVKGLIIDMAGPSAQLLWLPACRRTARRHTPEFPTGC